MASIFTAELRCLLNESESATAKQLCQFQEKSRALCWVCAGTAKIADVGLARIMQHTLSNTATGDPAGTFAYAAPEMLMGEKWDDKVSPHTPPHCPTTAKCNSSCNNTSVSCVKASCAFLSAV